MGLSVSVGSPSALAAAGGDASAVAASLAFDSTSCLTTSARTR